MVLGAVGASIRVVNYSLYTAAIAASVLIAIDLPHRASKPAPSAAGTSPGASAPA